jgi:hypothetical protein
MTQLTVGLKPMSQVCVKCASGVDHDVEVCPKNYTGSLKGMEAAGAA